MRGGMEQYMTPMGPTKLHVMPLFEIGPLEPRFSEWLVFEGARPRPLERLLEWLALEAARPRPWQALCALQQRMAPRAHEGTGHARNADTHAMQILASSPTLLYLTDHLGHARLS